MKDTAGDAYARERQYDAAALRIAERVRSSLALEDVLRQTLDELGLATEVSRSIIQLTPDESGAARMIEWDRGDTSPLNVVPPTPIARRVFSSGEPIIVEDVGQLADRELVDYLRAAGSTAAIGYPITWQGRVIAVLGFHDSRARPWRDDALPLLARLDTQVAAAVAQAELFEQQTEALARLEDLTRMREELVANVSHELRTPLTAIMGVVKTLKREDIDLEHADRDVLLDVLEQQTERLHVLAQDLLDLARFRRGERLLERTSLPFSDVVARALHGVDVPEGREVVLRIEDDVEVDVDPLRMSQVLGNLLLNAVRHGDGEISVRCLVDGDNAVFHVSDEGGGVRPEFAAEMFEPFVHNGLPDSSGLGLAIARAIVESHGGTLVYLAPDDEQPHQFVVTLPAAVRGNA